MSQSINLYNQLAKSKLFKKTINFDLKRIKTVLKKLNHPEKQLKNVINVIGSDGKFSLLTSLKFFIEANQQTTSAYISPSIKNIKERFWMGKEFLNYREIKDTIRIIKKQKINLTIFEVLTVVFILNAAKRKNDFNLIEAGALFAKDSTNLFDFPRAQVVVNINKQHLNFLKKKTLDEVINQKVGFLSNFTKIYVGKQKSTVLRKIKKRLKNNSSNIDYSYSWKLIKSKNNFYYKDKKNKLLLRSKYIHSKGLLINLCLAIKIALDLKIPKKIIIRTIPKIKYQGRLEYLNKGKIIKKINKNEKILIDGCHSETSARNLAEYLKTLNLPVYGIWGMTKNKNPDLFIKQFRGIFKKIFTVTIENETAALPNTLLSKIAEKNDCRVQSSNSFEQALKIISSKEKKIICVFGSLYLCGNVLNKN